MRTDVFGKNLEVTEAIRTHAEAKAAKLTKFFDGLQQVRITLSREDHHKHGQFDVEVVLDVEKHEDFVAHAKSDDLYAAIDEALQKGARQLTQFKEKLKQGKR